MKNCERCNTEHDGTFGTGRFCSRNCANSRECDSAKKERISEGVKRQNAAKGPQKRVLTEEQRQKWRTTRKTNRDSKLNSALFETLSYGHKRDRVLKEQNSSCLWCETSVWNGVAIPLEIHHIDGDNQNDVRENLVALCPNCHSTTENWRGKNKGKTKKERATDEDLREQLKTKNVRQSLLSLGYTPKGRNYVRANRILETMDLT